MRCSECDSLPRVDHVRRVVIGIGSNEGDREGYIRAAIDRLSADPDLHVLERSTIYESPPAGGPPQGDYLNAAVLVATAIAPREILRRLLDVERSLGRTRTAAQRWGPRTIDLDVLWIEGEAVDEPDLTVPHPRLKERPFAVRPLLELVPDAADPHTTAPYSALPSATAPLRTFSP